MFSLMLMLAFDGWTAEKYAKIIGGFTSANNDWPWMAALVYRSDATVFCGGTLVAKNWVLTAAHCLRDKNLKDKNPTDLEVLINKANLFSSQGERIAVKRAVLHPLFVRKTLENDIALLELKTPSQNLPIETLPNYSPLDEAGKQAIALGWGNLSNSGEEFPDNLQQVALPIVSNVTCKVRMTGIDDNMLCAGYAEGGKDTCEGDSGGPLVVYDQESASWRQAGITSFGQSACAVKGYYGVYTRLDQFNAFISDTICSAPDIPPTPSLKLSIVGQEVTATWTTSVTAKGYRLNYAPFPAGYPIDTLTPQNWDNFSVKLSSGSAFYVAIDAYQGNCRSGFSNVEHFVLD